MRFPRLSHLFHRRTKSDPELSRLASAPIAMPETRPVSTAYIAELLDPFPSDSTTSSDLFAAYVPPVPLAFPPPPSNLPPLGHTPYSRFYRRSSAPVDYHHHSIVTVLTHRIRDLEAALREERDAREVAIEANGALADDVTALQTEILQLQNDLFTTLSDAPGPSTEELEGADWEEELGQDRREGLASENAVLAARCDRLRRFVEIMLAAGEPKPVVQCAYDAVLEGAEPEAALVAAIRDAVARPGNVWRALLEPVTGVRTQEEYLAQVRCTLGARASAQDWRKRAAFWKGAAREDGRHAETVTPSVSALDPVVDALPLERRERVEGMLERLRAGELPLRVAKKADRGLNVGCVGASPEELAILAREPSARLSPSTSAEQSHAQALAGLDAPSSEPASVSSLCMDIPASSSSMVLPVTASTSTARDPSVYSNLPPLASETFRASHSIKSVSSKGSRRSSRALHAPASTPPAIESSLCARGPRDSITPSVSASTQGSAKSRRRRAKIVAVPVHSNSESGDGAFAASATKSTSRWSFFGPSRSTASGVSASAESGQPRPVSVEETDSAHGNSSGAQVDDEAALGVFGSSDIHPSFQISVDTAPDVPMPSTPSRPSTTSLPRALLDFSSSPEDDLVLVLHSDFSGSSYRAAHAPEPRCPPASPTPGAGPGSANTTPEKRSRLPVRIQMPGLRAIRRISASIHISRPVLVETTNVAVSGFGLGDGPLRGSAATGTLLKPVGCQRGVPGDLGQGQEAASGRMAMSVGPAGALAGSPPRPSKIPMGKRLHKFGIGGQA